ncbi:MAG: NAD(P)(+) transhydrogenase [Deltaproteobacteria bacterium 13_1_40CM_4_68_19]|nr:MAG: NAD(P)(+) transhydrogenase [Deltaproteobacteria bacterium 13_1_40CM_4_68_19]OLD09886.1 MAG: NAD(P)(+) transhydrogenase [Deltaproteobacteria bacterium 13_1_40CM_3_69_14]OLD47402.1 MAG: NAD(P)(+) transhydrogenase [Chloroflexi bacterium 13_1_40CM_2_68_14]
MENSYDLVVIGSGPAGQKGAICAAKLRKKVAIVDRGQRLGGVSLHTGTIPSKTLREAILYLSGFRQRSFYGSDYVLQEIISMPDLSRRVTKVREHELEVVRNQLRRNGVTVLEGSARFTGPNALSVETNEGSRTIKAENVLIACGTRPARHPDIPCDGKCIFDSDQLIALDVEMPRSAIVVGAGVIGLEYASMLTALNIKTTVVDQRPTLLDFVDREIIDALTYHMRVRKTIFRLGEQVKSVSVDAGRVVARLESDKTLSADALFYTVGRQANTDQLDLPAAGLKADARGRVAVDHQFRTAVPHIFAAGDTIGFPALASTSMEQGRRAALAMFGRSQDAQELPLPYGIYTIPEISMVGRTEQELTAGKVRYEVGIARYEELAKSQILGDHSGLLKLVFDPDSLKLLGVHCIGERAAEIVHIGQAVLAFGGTIGYFRDAVFNYPTMAEAFKVAALDGFNKLA